MSKLVIMPTQIEYDCFLTSIKNEIRSFEHCSIGKIPVVQIPDDDIVVACGGLEKVLPLFREDRLTSLEISQRLGVNDAITNRALFAPTDLGYVQYGDGQGSINVTQAAKSVSADIKGVLRGWSQTLTQGFTKEEKVMALTLLQRMNTNAANAL